MVIKRKRQGGAPVKANAKFYVFLGVVAAAVIAIVYFVTSIQTITLEAGEIRYETETPVVVVRDEQVYAPENYGRANLLVPEGERVEADTPVAEVYTWSYNPKTVDELTEKQKVIEQYQEKARLDADDPDLLEINDNITKKSVEIKSIINNGAGNLLLAERELKTLMQQKREYLKDAVPAGDDPTLVDFYNQETQLQDRVDSWRETVNAPQAGVVSYFFDGSERLLNANNLQQITMQDIHDILNGTVLPDETGDESIQPLYRLVSNFRWYMLVHMDQPMMEFANDTPYEIAFNDYPDRTYQGKIVGHISEDNDYIYVMEVLEDIGSLLNVRRTDARMYTRFEGLKVPESVLKEKDGVMGVNVVSGREKTFVPVNVKIIRDGSAIIESLDENKPLAANQQVEA